MNSAADVSSGESDYLQVSTTLATGLSSGHGNFSAHNSSSTVVDDSYALFFQVMQQLTGIYLLPFISVFGIVGNVINVIVYKRSQKYSTNVYLIALYLSDIVKLFNDFIYFLVSLISNLDPSMGEYLFYRLYNYTHYIFVQSGLNTSWLTCTIAFDRYLAVGETTVRKSDHNYFQSIIVSIVTFLLSALLAVPAPLLGTVATVYDPVTNTNSTKLVATAFGSIFAEIYRNVIAVLRSFLPILILVVLDCQIIRTVYKNKMRRKGMRNAKNTQSNVTSMLITIVLIFTICTIPDAIMSAMRLGYANESNLVRGIREITDLFLAINSAVTFPICYYFSVQFRLKFKQLMSRESAGTGDATGRIAADKFTHGGTRAASRSIFAQPNNVNVLNHERTALVAAAVATSNLAQATAINADEAIVHVPNNEQCAKDEQADNDDELE